MRAFGRKISRWHHDLVQSVALTLDEAAQVLQPPVTARQLRAVVHALGMQPAGTRRNGRRGPPVAHLLRGADPATPTRAPPGPGTPVHARLYPKSYLMHYIALPTP